MNWCTEILDGLAAKLPCGYLEGGPPATEPTALVALSLCAHGRFDAARAGLDWLAKLQAADGSLGINDKQAAPGWPTSMAIIAWRAAGARGGYANNIERGVGWLTTTAGKPLARSEGMGHNTTLIGWPWVLETHSWLEPTAWAVLALKATGHGDHPRAREGVSVLVDRLLPGGGCNYGNTTVLGQELRPHVQPTGLALLALADEPVSNGRIQASVDYLRRELSARTTTSSLCYGLLGWAAHGIPPTSSNGWLEAAVNRTLAGDGSPAKLALAALAALGVDCPLIKFAGREAVS